MYNMALIKHLTLSSMWAQKWQESTTSVTRMRNSSKAMQFAVLMGLSHLFASSLISWQVKSVCTGDLCFKLPETCGSMVELALPTDLAITVFKEVHIFNFCPSIFLSSCCESLLLVVFVTLLLLPWFSRTQFLPGFLYSAFTLTLPEIPVGLPVGVCSWLLSVKPNTAVSGLLKLPGDGGVIGSILEMELWLEP